jgi:hypothetical protein
MANNLDYLPWNWTITANANANCPPPSSILGTFAIVNVLVSIGSLIVAHSGVTRFISCGLGGKDGSTAWRYTWPFPLGFQLASNALIAYVIKNTADYESTYPVARLMLLYTARPRLSFIVLGCATTFTWSRSQNKLGPFHSAFMSTFISESLLELLGMYMMGLTVNFAAKNGYYILGTDKYNSIPEAAHLMYAGALCYLICGPLSALYVAAALTDRHGFISSPKWGALQMLAVLEGLWIPSWLFWAGYIKLAGALYDCSYYYGIG